MEKITTMTVYFPTGQLIGRSEYMVYKTVEGHRTPVVQETVEKKEDMVCMPLKEFNDYIFRKEQEAFQKGKDYGQYSF